MDITLLWNTHMRKDIRLFDVKAIALWPASYQMIFQLL